MPRLFAAGALAIGGLLFAAVSQAQVEIEDPWIREAPPGARMLAGYMVLENSGEAPATLTGAQSPAFERVELHRTETVGGVARMVPQDAVPIPGGERVSFEPGGLHLMLIGPRSPLQAGQRVPVELHLGEGGSLSAQFEVRRTHGAAPAHAHPDRGHAH